MTDLAIDANRLKSIRTARKIGRPKLAKMTGTTERQVTKLETGALASLSPDMIDRLAEALEVSPQTLTGEADLCSTDLMPAMSTKSCSCC